MVATKTGRVPSKSPSAQLAEFIAPYTPEIASRARAVLAKMRKRLPGAFELVYDYYNGLVIGYVRVARRRAMAYPPRRLRRSGPAAEAQGVYDQVAVEPLLCK